MSVIFYDGFDNYSVNVPPSIRWPTVVGSSWLSRFVAGRFGGQCFKGSAGASFQLTHPLDTPRDTVSVGFAINQTAIGAGQNVFAFLDAASAGICTLFCSTSGDLVFVRGTSYTSNILVTVPAYLALGVWHYIEIEFTRNATTGSVNIYGDGVLIGSASGVNTGAASVANCKLYASLSSASGASQLDDYYCVSGATRLGERRVITTRPSADTAQKDFAPDSGVNNYSRVNEEPMDGDTSYVSAAIVGNEDLYDFADLPYVPASIDAVQVVCAARKDDATTRTVATVLKSGATTDVGPDLATSASYGAAQKMYELDPNTSAAWTGAAVNALQAGMKVTT